MNTLWQYLRFGLRMLTKNPGFTAVAVVTLALGIGANTAIFSVMNAVLLRPLPYPEAERILRVGQQFGNSLWAAGEPKFLFWREHTQSFEALAAYQYIGSGFNLAGGSEAEYVNGLRVSADFFRVLGVGPALGRHFTNEEDLPGGAPVVILSNGLWQRRFGSDSSLIGNAVSLNGMSFTVVGVLPPSFRFLPQADIIVPMRPSLQGDPNPNQTVIGRLRLGVSLQQAQDEMKRLADEYRAAFPRQMQSNESAGVEPYQELFTGDIRRLLWILFGAVAFLLLIACANVANLQLTRAAARQKEVAIRLALGADWWRIARQLLAESLLLALIGGGLGAFTAMWATDAMQAAMPKGLLPDLNEIAFDWRVLVFTFTASVFTGIVFGLAPAIQATRVDVNDSLKEGAGKGAGSTTQGRLRGALVVTEVALSLILLIGATLLIRTFASLRGVEPGFDSRNVLTFYISPNGERYDSTAKTAAFYQQALERINSLPGVETAATTNVLPLVAQLNLPVDIAGHPADQPITAQYRMVSPDYFKVLKIPLRQGRSFTDADNAGAQNVVIVNETFARNFLQDAEPLSQTLNIGRGFGGAPCQIIGIAGDVKQFGLDSKAPPTVFVPAPQVPDKLLRLMRRFIAGYFIVRTTVDPLRLSAAVKRELASLDPALPLSSLRSMEEIVSRSVAPQRFNMLLVGLFAGLGLLLAAVGIYGVIAYAVTERTHEIGIRLAIGAQASDVFKLVIGQGMLLTFIGVVVGLIAARALTRLMASLLFGVSATDPVTFIIIALLLAGVALLACWIPARQATKVDPMVALRYE